MAIGNVTPQEAQEKSSNASIPYVDVRSIPEFDQGHPQGAYNVPFLHVDPGTGEMTPNADFDRVMQAAFAPGTELVLGCKSGGRSMMAAERLQTLGYAVLWNMLGGFGGGQAPDGSAVPGWAASGLPVDQQAEPGRDYASLSTGG